jgi:hypothetical protein
MNAEPTLWVFSMVDYLRRYPESFAVILNDAQRSEESGSGQTQYRIFNEMGIRDSSSSPQNDKFGVLDFLTTSVKYVSNNMLLPEAECSYTPRLRCRRA